MVFGAKNCFVYLPALPALTTWHFELFPLVKNLQLAVIGKHVCAAGQ